MSKAVIQEINLCGKICVFLIYNDRFCSDLKCSGFEKCEINAYEHFSTEYGTRDVCSNQRGLGDMEILYSCYGTQKRTNFRRLSKSK